MREGFRVVGGTRTDGGDSRDNLTQLQFVQNCRLSSGVEPNHQNAHLLLPPEAVEQLRERETHRGGGVYWYVVVRDCGEVACRGITIWLCTHKVSACFCLHYLSLPRSKPALWCLCKKASALTRSAKCPFPTRSAIAHRALPVSPLG